MPMNQLSQEWQRQIVVEEMWLHYYNRTLYEKGLISQRSYEKMRLEIILRTTRLRKGGTTKHNGKGKNSA